MDHPDRHSENSAFLAEFREVADESFLSEAESKYVAVLRSGAVPGGKLGWKVDGSLNLYGVTQFGPSCAMIRLPIDRVKYEADAQAFLERARRERKR